MRHGDGKSGSRQQAVPGQLSLQCSSLTRVAVEICRTAADLWIEFISGRDNGRRPAILLTLLEAPAHA